MYPSRKFQSSEREKKKKKKPKKSGERQHARKVQHKAGKNEKRKSKKGATVYALKRIGTWAPMLKGQLEKKKTDWALGERYA